MIPLDHEDLEALVRELVVLRKQTSELTGAAAGLLTSIERAGGWHVFDPHHQDPVALAFLAMRQALQAMLDARFDLPPLRLGESRVAEDDPNVLPMVYE